MEVRRGTPIAPLLLEGGGVSSGLRLGSSTLASPVSFRRFSSQEWDEYSLTELSPFFLRGVIRYVLHPVMCSARVVMVPIAPITTSSTTSPRSNRNWASLPMGHLCDARDAVAVADPYGTLELDADADAAIGEVLGLGDHGVLDLVGVVRVFGGVVVLQLDVPTIVAIRVGA